MESASLTCETFSRSIKVSLRLLATKIASTPKSPLDLRNSSGESKDRPCVIGPFDCSFLFRTPFDWAYDTV